MNVLIYPIFIIDNSIMAMIVIKRSTLRTAGNVYALLKVQYPLDIARVQTVSNTNYAYCDFIMSS